MICTSKKKADITAILLGAINFGIDCNYTFDHPQLEPRLNIQEEPIAITTYYYFDKNGHELCHYLPDIEQLYVLDMKRIWSKEFKNKLIINPIRR